MGLRCEGNDECIVTTTLILWHLFSPFSPADAQVSFTTSPNRMEKKQSHTNKNYVQEVQTVKLRERLARKRPARLSFIPFLQVARAALWNERISQRYAWKDLSEVKEQEALRESHRDSCVGGLKIVQKWKRMSNILFPLKSSSNNDRNCFCRCWTSSFCCPARDEKRREEIIFENS